MLAVSRKVQGVNVLVMTLEQVSYLSGLDVPDSNLFVLSASSKILPVG